MHAAAIAFAKRSKEDLGDWRRQALWAMMPRIVETLTGVPPHRQEECYGTTGMRDDGVFQYEYFVDGNQNILYGFAGCFIENVLYGRQAVIEVLGRSRKKRKFNWLGTPVGWNESGWKDLPASPCLFVVKDE